MAFLARFRERFAKAWFWVTHRPSFAELSLGALMFQPFRIDGAAGIRLGKNALLQRGGWLYCLKEDGSPASLMIGDGCVFGYNNHIAAVRSINIGDEVLTANNVYISDNIHEYENITVPIMRQPVRFKREVSIGGGSWIGENVCIIGASIGRNCAIGANSVVTHDIPDYCVAVGAPAVVIRRYNIETATWEKTGHAT